LVAELALQHGDLVPQDEDLGVLVVVAAGQQPQQREHVGHTEVRPVAAARGAIIA
jgi:hypothetical protein